VFSANIRALNKKVVDSSRL